jgi:pimeloyl-ACP methyl ester carboxylesterase
MSATLVEPARRTGRTRRTPGLGRTTLVAACVLAGAGLASGRLLDARGPVLGPLEWALRTSVVIAALVTVIGGLVLVARIRRRFAPRPLGWLAAAVAVVAFAWFVAVPLLYGLYLSHLPDRRAVGHVELGRAAQTVTLPGAHRLTLRGWYLPSRNGAAVLVLHGTGSNRTGVAAHARLLARHGYGVLLVDMAGHGESDGRSTSLPWKLDDSLDAALDWLHRRSDVDPGRIAVLGVSLGGETALQLAARRHDVRAVVAEGTIGSTFADARAAGEDAATVGQIGGLAIVTAVLSGEAPTSDEQLVRRIAPRPLLLISSGRGLEAAADRAFARAGGPSTSLWNLAQASHASGLATAPGPYERRVIAFLGRALPATTRDRTGAG